MFNYKEKKIEIEQNIIKSNLSNFFRKILISSINILSRKTEGSLTKRANAANRPIPTKSKIPLINEKNN